MEKMSSLDPASGKTGSWKVDLKEDSSRTILQRQSMDARPNGVQSFRGTDLKFLFLYFMQKVLDGDACADSFPLLRNKIEKQSKF